MEHYDVITAYILEKQQQWSKGINFQKSHNFSKKVFINFKKSVALNTYIKVNYESIIVLCFWHLNIQLSKSTEDDRKTIYTIEIINTFSLIVFLASLPRVSEGVKSLLSSKQILQSFQTFIDVMPDIWVTLWSLVFMQKN